MNVEIAATVIENGILLGLLLWLIYGPWQETVADILRQKLFEIRDELFDLASEREDFTFDSPAYRELRNTLNGMIRHAHFITWPRFLIFGWLTRRYQANESSLMDLIQSIEDPQLRDRVRHKIQAAVHAMIVSMILRSPILMGVLMLGFPVLIFWHLLSPMRLQRAYLAIAKTAAREAEFTASLPS